MSMTRSLWIASATLPSRWMPRESGPRCSSSSHIRAGSSGATGEPRGRTCPAMPHILIENGSEAAFLAGGGRRCDRDREVAGDHQEEVGSVGEGPLVEESGENEEGGRRSRRDRCDRGAR